MFKRKIIVSLAFFLSCIPSFAQDAQSTEQSCKNFVQSFYNWYAKQPDGQTSESAVKLKKGSFSPDLRAALQADFDAAAKSPGEIVGLDFDPFLNAQDIAKKYTVTAVKRNGSTFLVDVYGTWEGKKSTKPDVVPELKNENGKWVFVNFHYGKSEYPVNENLISILKQLKTDREKPVKN